ncbi:class I SAM-dependent methyltransferase [Nitriliruptoria bacterium AS10]|nr:class I SAM-dependent methyltransferase [Salsipaludibacter albus]MBY5164026.1 class I SAM-dependent methyltransferase [Salsipaludibacter albus]
MWDDRAPAHAASRDYRVEEYRTDPDALSTVVAFDRQWLGDIAGRSAVHLQCHIGTDTISLARLGATPVVGLDLSPASIEQARGLAADTGDEVEFVVGPVDDAVELLGGRTFDLVYTGVGALCWLPDIDRWGGVVADLLAPGGTVFVRDAHPVLLSLDDEDDTFTLRYPYFETDEPITWTGDDTYVDVADHQVADLPSHEWNHGLGEIVTALLDRGLVVDHLVEHTWTDWPPWGLWEPVAPGFWALPEPLRAHLPTMFSVRARRPSST